MFNIDAFVGKVVTLEAPHCFFLFSCGDLMEAQTIFCYHEFAYKTQWQIGGSYYTALHSKTKGRGTVGLIGRVLLSVFKEKDFGGKEME